MEPVSKTGITLYLHTRPELKGIETLPFHEYEPPLQQHDLHTRPEFKGIETFII